jgi:hypothetical protein
MRRRGTVLLLVHGRSGVGKTTLVERFLESLQVDEQTIVLKGRCFAQESVPYKALDGVIDALGRTLARLGSHDVEAVLPRDFSYLCEAFPTMRLVQSGLRSHRPLQEIPNPRELRKRCIAALRDLLGRLGDRRPLVIFIDDLQWGDNDSAALLVDLLQQPDPPPLLLIGCYRREDASTSPFVTQFLQAFGSGGSPVDLRELAVDELEQEDALDLSQTLFRRDPDAPVTHELLTTVARESEGNPFFIGELVRHARTRAGKLDPFAGGCQISLDELIGERLRGLSPEASQVLKIIAVFGRPIGEAEACRAAGVGATAQALLVQLRAGRLIRNASTEISRCLYEAYHDRIRETLLALIPSSELENLHLSLATTLEEMKYPVPEVLAIHFREAGRHAQASTCFALAGDQSMSVLAFERAASMYRMAIELDPIDLARSRRLRVKLGDALANAGRGSAAASEYLAAANGSAESLTLRRRAALQYLISGHVEQGLATLREVLSHVGMSLPRTTWGTLSSLLLSRARLRLRGLPDRPKSSKFASQPDLTRSDICWSASIGLSIIDPIRGAAFQARGLLWSLRAGEPHRMVRALAMEAAHVACAGVSSRHRTATLLEAAQSLAPFAPAPYTNGILSLTNAMVATLQSRWQETHPFAERAEAIFRDRCTGVAWEIDTARIFSLWSLMYLGEIAEVRRRWPELMKDATERGDMYMAGTLGTWLMATVRLADDDVPAAEEELRQAPGLSSRHGFHIQHHNRVLAECSISLYRGEQPEVWNRLLQLWPTYARSLLLRLQVIRIELRRLLALGALTIAARSRDRTPCVRRAASEASRLEREGIHGAAAHAQLIRAQIAAHNGDVGNARQLFEAAIATYSKLGMSIFAAAARRRLGQLLGGDEGNALVIDADRWMTSQGIRHPPRMAALYIAPDWRSGPLA